MGGGTPFEGMSHEAMLAWLDQANSGTVQGAADRLAAAAKEIRKIAEDLKVRPQWVEWKGGGRGRVPHLERGPGQRHAASG